MYKWTNFLIIGFFLLQICSCRQEPYDLIIKGGNILDGSGNPAYRSDIAVRDGRIVELAGHIEKPAEQIIDAGNLAVAPGFIDMLSWASGPIVYDGEVHSVIRQGITTAVFGEGWSMGPVNDKVREAMENFWPEYHISYEWNTLADYLRFLEKRGISINVASYVGATTVRLYVMGQDDRRPSSEEMDRMRRLVETEMAAGAFGVASSLVYTPAFYADTGELIELAKVAAKYGGIYASHIRGEGEDLFIALDEFIEICEKAGIPGEIYHFKAAGKDNFNKLDRAIAMVEDARSRGLDITGDIYPYTAGATGLDAMIPPWAKEGGDSALVRRLKDPGTRAQIRQEILNSKQGWDNFYRMAGGGEGILVSYLAPERKDLQGKYISEIARQQNRDELEAVFDLLIAEKGGGGGIYFMMSEENVKKKMKLPWISFCTDEDAYKPEGLMGRRNPHPRAYGTFPRVLGHYVRDEQLLSIEEAIRKMTSLPAERLGLKDRGYVRPDMMADIVIFDPEKVRDLATYTNPHQFPDGIAYVLVNGKVVVDKGRHTGAKPGRALFSQGSSVEKP
jgi:N-acyl-D-amino-acid deacylase